MEAAGLTDVGRLRKNNEDSYAIQGSLLVVADGMGGAAAGEIASSVAVKTIIDDLTGLSYSTDSKTAKKVRQVIEDADNEIKSRMGQNPELEGMGTTVVLSIHFDDRLLIANVGDSRAYMIKAVSGAKPQQAKGASMADANAQTAILEPISLDGNKKISRTISRISDDHSVVMDLVNSGVISEEDIRTHPLRNRITRCVGSLHGEGADITWHDVEDNDLLILCSDGLWEMVHEDIILAVATSSDTLDEACKRLIDAANDAGGADNITVITARFTKKK